MSDGDLSAAAWARFLSDVADARRRLRCSEADPCEPWYRGCRQSDYKLIPSLFRGFENRERIYGRIVAKESDLFWEFAARARELHGSVDEDWDVLFAMQHYGTPTRLLDWTEVLSVAVYFGVLAVPTPEVIEPDGTAWGTDDLRIHPPCIWVMNPYLLNDTDRWVAEGHEPDVVHPPNLGWDEKEGTYYTYGDLLSFGMMDWSAPVAIYPRQRNARMHAQRAWFTIHGDDVRPMEEFADSARYLERVTLPFEALPAARQFLEQAGINHYLLFADLENLSLHLMEKNRLITSAAADERIQQRLDRRDLGDSILSIARTSLQQRSLDAMFLELERVRSELRRMPLSEPALRSSLGGERQGRLVGYVELQMRPRPLFLPDMIAAFHLEFHLALTRSETRLLWQVLETFHRLAETNPKLSEPDASAARVAVGNCLQFLQQNPRLDPGRQCRLSSEALLGKL